MGVVEAKSYATTWILADVNNNDIAILKFKNTVNLKDKCLKSVIMGKIFSIEETIS